MKPNRFPRSSRGFTLAEVIVASAIFVIIIVAALLVYDRSNKVFKSSVELADMQQNSRVGFEKLVADVRMAGFDYDRDGFPQLAGQFQQPDEQIEYAGAGAITVRGNFDAELGEAGDVESGRESGFGIAADNLESVAFPIVTTENSEIVTYALKSFDSTKNTSTITFYADLNRPRNVKPGGVSEDKIDITGVDTTNANPPYTLYRITIADDKSQVHTPLAENVRSLRFAYFSDTRAQGVVAAIGGDGQYNPATPNAPLPDRVTRGTIRSVRIEYTGMNGQRDINYVNPAETDTAVTGAVNYRTYNLASVVVPRNLGLRGLVEQDVSPPGAPTITSVCIGACGLAYVTWDKPPGGAPVSSYSVVVDPDPAGSFANLTAFGNVTSGWVGGVQPLDPTKAYYFRVRSLNGYGSNISAKFPDPLSSPGLQPVNTTKMEPPTAVVTTGNATSNAMANVVRVKWQTPANNVSGGYVNCASPPSAATVPAYTEAYGYDVYRSITSPVDTSTTANRIFGATLSSPGAPVLDTTGALTYLDKTPKKNCQTYYYKIRVVETCNNGLLPAPPNILASSVSGFSAEAFGNSIAGNPPAAPTGMIALGTSNCNSGSNTCVVDLKWNEPGVDTSTPPAALQISRYVLRRETVLNGLVTNTEDISVTGTAGAGTATYTDSRYADSTPLPMLLGPDPYRYRYTVSALDCEASPTPSQSAFSTPALQFPCATLFVDPPATGVLSGTGSASSPYLITSPTSSFTVRATTTIATISATLTRLPAGSPSAVTPVFVNATTYTLNVPLSGNDGTNYKLDVMFTDPSGCSLTNTVYIEDSPSTCCLVPFTFDATVVKSILVSGLPRTIEITASNNCDLDLRLISTSVQFRNTGGRDLSKIEYVISGTTVKTDLFSPASSVDPVIVPRAGPLPTAPDSRLTLPANVTIPAASTSYKIRYTFDRDTLPTNITNVTITYNPPPAGANTACQIK